MPKVRFIPECHADTALVRFLTDGFPHIDHEAGINNVVRNFSAIKDQTYCLVGIVDDDKRKPSYLSGFEVVKSEYAVSLCNMPGTKHYIVIIKPALEKFLIQEAATVGISLSDFNLPNDLKSLCKTTKKPQIETNEGYIEFLSALKSRKARGLVVLETFLSDFIIVGNEVEL